MASLQGDWACGMGRDIQECRPGGEDSPYESMLSLWGLPTCAPPDTIRAHPWGPSALRIVWEGRTEWRALSSRREWRVAGTGGLSWLETLC